MRKHNLHTPYSCVCVADSSWPGKRRARRSSASSWHFYAPSNSFFPPRNERCVHYAISPAPWKKIYLNRRRCIHRFKNSKLHLGRSRPTLLRSPWVYFYTQHSSSRLETVYFINIAYYRIFVFISFLFQPFYKRYAIIIFYAVQFQR